MLLSVRIKCAVRDEAKALQRQRERSKNPFEKISKGGVVSIRILERLR